MTQEFDDEAAVVAVLRACLRDVLGLDAARVAAFTEATPLFGALPELDSMAAAGLLAEIEDRIGIRVDEIDGDALSTFGTLVTFVLSRALG